MRGNIGPELAPVVEMAWRTAAAGLGTEGRMGRAAKCALGAGRLSVFNRKWYHPHKGWYTKQTAYLVHVSLGDSLHSLSLRRSYQ